MDSYRHDRFRSSFLLEQSGELWALRIAKRDADAKTKGELSEQRLPPLGANSLQREAEGGIQWSHMPSVDRSDTSGCGMFADSTCPISISDTYKQRRGEGRDQSAYQIQERTEI